jgi:LPS-assembly protein
MTKSYPSPSKDYLSSTSKIGVVILLGMILGFSAQPHAQNEPNNKPLSLRLDDKLVEHDDQADEKSITFSKSKSEGTKDRDLVLKESAEVRKNGTVIKADQIDYDIDTDTLKAIGEYSDSQ